MKSSIQGQMDGRFFLIFRKVPKVLSTDTVIQNTIQEVKTYSNSVKSNQ